MQYFIASKKILGVITKYRSIDLNIDPSHIFVSCFTHLVFIQYPFRMWKVYQTCTYILDLYTGIVIFFCSFLWPFHHNNQNIKSNIYTNSHLFWHYTSSPICMTHDFLLTLFKAEIVLAALDTAPLRLCMSPFPCTIPDSSDPQDLWGQGPPALLTAMLGSFVWNTKATAAELCFLHITPAAFHQLESYMYT